MPAGSKDYYIRVLTPDNWREYSIIRLEALKNNPHVFLSAYDDEKDRTPEEWQKVIGNNNKQCQGLYCDDDLVGITCIIEWRDNHYVEPVGAIVSNYIKPEHRGKNLSDGMYQACISFAANRPQWKKIIVTHREGNEASRRTIEKRGFKFSYKISMTWHDGVQADEYVYEIDLEKLRNNHSTKVG